MADAPVVSSVEDLALFLKSLIIDESFINQNVRDTIFADTNLQDLGNDIYYGLGIYKETIMNKTVYHHGGLEPGYSTTNIYIVETQTSITAFFNCGVSDSCENETDLLVQTVLQNEL